MGVNRLEPKLLTVGDLFGDGEAVYTVPVYQRNYAWRAEQIEQLISDIQDAIVDGEDGYFLGNLIVTRRKSPTTDYEVIDGQQRLTTLYLLLTMLAGTRGGFDKSLQDRLRYESRPRATEALRRIAAEMPRRSASIPHTPTSDDAAIHAGFNVIRQFFNQHPELRDEATRADFEKFLRSKVTLVRACLPPKTDLNRYFEIMNTRGQQLQQVDIVKARLMSHLPNEAERACFAWIWDACADMESYVQMSLTRGEVRLRGELFGEDWSWLVVRKFKTLLEHHQSAETDGTNGTRGKTSTSLDEALTRYAAIGTSTTNVDVDNVRFRSTIEFPAFLLHVLKVVNDDEEEEEGHLDDKRLIKRFDESVRAATSSRARWVREFAVSLLNCRNLFDAFVLKRQYTATNGDDGDWSLQRLLKRKSRGRPTPGYVNSFSGVGADVEEDGDVDPTTSELLLLQSMLRVTYTSPRTMHWITQLLKFLGGSEPSAVGGSEVVDLLRRHARDKVKEAFFGDEQPVGFNVSRVVFTYLDYLLLTDQRNSEFRFSFRNSIEHFYPQHPDEQQSGAKVSAECIDLLGNLALVSVSANAKFSNSLPKAKAENFRLSIELQSPKLQLMAAVTREHGWGGAQVRAHHEAMVERLLSDIRPTPRRGASRDGHR